ncbi:hypothetical protein GCM10010210_51770 [Pseudonocardia hydrocarbonoxydans]|uniref:Uncharacterized protein n=1 Tax=Pseudonocardia hydrocarbonoxydans TaxID=76726 RepID=A0A4Y3WZ92_9PSEU|nr:hypothetical protein PHY01_50490 [Pseudonocardia hydrocarbonoxydans]
MLLTDVSSHDLARAIASRLDAVAPRGLRVTDEGASVRVLRGGAWIGGSAAPEIVTGRADERRVETAARAVISGVQDVFAEVLAEPWPASRGEMPAPDARVEEGVLHAWFGSAERPVLSLEPYELSAR